MYVGFRGPLEEARARTLALTDDLTDEEARRQPDPAFSPIGWHLGHVAWTEEVWLHRRVMGRRPLDPALDGLFDSFRSEKGSRGRRLPPMLDIRAYAARVRGSTLSFLETPRPSPLLEGGWVLHFLCSHETQHAETIAVGRLLARLALPGASAYAASGGIAAPSGWVSLEGGEFPMGNDLPGAWDNERPVHPARVEAFLLGSRPVTNGEWICFVEAGGYGRDELWSEEGRRAREAGGISLPLFWVRKGERYLRFTLGGEVEVDPEEPVGHVSWYEAEAFARWTGARLPDEVEWEWAARLGRGEGRGRVWEWTADPFRGYPGFAPGPYRGYSAPWFGEGHRVLRGGSHLSHPLQKRPTFRNWFVPTMRAYPTGLRLARQGE